MSNLREAAQKLVTAWDADDELGISLALVDLTEALAQPDDKAQPVAEVYRGHYGGRNGNVGFDGVRPLRGAKLPPPGTKLYAAPQPPAEQGVAAKAIAAAYEQHRHYRETMRTDEQGAELSDEQIKEGWALLEYAAKWLNRAPHGDNCFVSDHYEGDPGDRCNCGKDSLLAAIEASLEARGGAA